MSSFHWWASTAGSLLLALACGGRSPEPEAAPTAASQQNLLTVKGETLRIEVASSFQQRAQGLMFRKELAPDSGMLFVFEGETRLSFWMKDTYIPLSIAFISSGGIIVDTQDMEPLVTATYISERPARFALEVNQGWFKEHDVGPGDTVRF